MKGNSFVCATTRFERRSIQSFFALHEHQTPIPGSGDCVIQQSALLLCIPTDRVRPDHDDSIEFPILGLVNRHRREASSA
jgi:hypothetical protein